MPELPADIKSLAQYFYKGLGEDRILDIVCPEAANSHSKYSNDPVGFCETIFKETYTDSIKEMMESVRDNVVTLCRSANGTGKTHGGARVATWFYECLNGSQVYTAAAPPEANLKKLLWGEIGSLVEKYPEVFKSDRVTILHIEKSAKEFLTGVSIPTTGTEKQREAKFSGKHAPYLLFIIDEGDAVPDEVYKGIESCMSGGHARLLIFFNPRQKVGKAYRLERDKQANVIVLSAFDHPNVITGKDIYPGAVTQSTTIRRINTWCRPLLPGEPKDDETFELPEFLVGKTAKSDSGEEFPPLKAGFYKIEEPAFSYMVLGRYPAQDEYQLISEQWINNAVDRWKEYTAIHGANPPKVRPIMGMDVAEFGKDQNVLCSRYNDYVSEFKVWWKVNIPASEKIAEEEYLYKMAKKINIDGTGLGAGVADHLTENNKSVVAQSVKVAWAPTYETPLGKFKIMRDQLAWTVRTWLETNPNAMLPPDEELREELLAIKYANIDGFIRTSKKDLLKDVLKRSPNKFDSLALTFIDDEVFYTDDDLDDCFTEDYL